MYRVWFDFSLRLKEPLNVHEGHCQSLINHVGDVERQLGLVRLDCGDNAPRWEHSNFEGIQDRVLCDVAKEHNQWMRELYHYWASKPDGPEVLTPEMAQQVWHALAFIRVPPHRWTADYYRDSMVRLFDVMVTGDRDGISFDVKTLTPVQAAQVVLLFSEFLDTEDIRLTLPDEWGHLADGENCQWCSKREVNVHDEDWCNAVAHCDDEECQFVLSREEGDC